MSTDSERPIGVTLIAILDILAFVVLLIVAVVMAKGPGWANLPAWTTQAIVSRSPFMALLALVPGAIGLGLWNLQNWARMVTLALSVFEFLVIGYRLAFSEVVVAVLFNSPFGFPALFIGMMILRLLFNAVIAIYLLRPNVAQAFAEAW